MYWDHAPGRNYVPPDPEERLQAGLGPLWQPGGRDLLDTVLDELGSMRNPAGQPEPDEQHDEWVGLGRRLAARTTAETAVPRAPAPEPEPDRPDDEEWRALARHLFAHPKEES